MEIMIRNNILTNKNETSFLNSNRNYTQKTEKTISKTQMPESINDTVGIEVSNEFTNKVKEKENSSIELQNTIKNLQTNQVKLEKSSEELTLIKETTNGIELTEEEEKQIIQKVEKHLEDTNKITNSGEFQNIQLVDGNKEALQISLKGESEDLKNSKKEDKAQNIIQTVNDALKIINSQRSKIETYQKDLNISIESNKANTSQITDKEIANLSADIAKQNILHKSTKNLDMQINTSPSIALNLLAA